MAFKMKGFSGFKQIEKETPPKEKPLDRRAEAGEESVGRDPSKAPEGSKFIGPRNKIVGEGYYKPPVTVANKIVGEGHYKPKGGIVSFDAVKTKLKSNPGYYGGGRKI